VVVFGHGDWKYPAKGEKGSTGLASPWIRKFDFDGQLLWDHELFGQTLPALWETGLKDLIAHCNMLVSTKRGGVVVALTAEEVKGATLVDRKIALPEKYYDKLSSPMTILIELDKDGKELHRLLRSSKDEAYLFKAVNGYILVEHSAHPARGLAGAMLLMTTPILVPNSVHVTKIDENLLVQRHDSTRIAELPFGFSSVMPDPDGGVWLTGSDESNNYVAHLNSSMTVTMLQRIRPLPNIDPSRMRLALGRDSSEVLVFMGSLDIGSVVMRVKAK
jgi:hypothetical protein